jgi:hypothetical protein
VVLSRSSQFDERGGLSEQSGAEESVSEELGERVRAIVAAAESMAAAVRSDADSYAQARRREADEEAKRRLREATEQANTLLSDRLTRIAELSERILARGEAVLGRIEGAEEVRGQLEEVTRALGEAAQRVTSELDEIPSIAKHEPDAVEAFEEPGAFEDPVEEHPMAEQVRPLRPPGEPIPRPLRPMAPAHVPRDESETRLDDARLVALQMAVAGRSREEVGAHLRQAFDVGDPDPILDHVFAEGFPPRPPVGGD